MVTRIVMNVDHFKSLAKVNIDHTLVRGAFIVLVVG